VKQRFMQSTLRELQIFSRSRNFWLVFCAVVALFAVTGPFGTLETLRPLPRLLYWFVLHAASWSIAIVCVIIANALFASRITTMFVRTMIGALFAALPIGLASEVIHALWFGRSAAHVDILQNVLQSLPLCAIFCVIAYLSMSNDVKRHAGAQVDASREPPSAPAPEAPQPTPKDRQEAEPPLLARLNPANRGSLRHISVEDHYTCVTTSRGRELILLRFADALKETGATAGLQAHRSHWVADAFVKTLARTNGKLTLVLVDGAEIPVSRTYAQSVRDRYGK
jgi:DNA-binding LytR/AlgR family response regulator